MTAVLDRRLELELTQQEAADKAGVSYRTMARAEQGLPVRRLSQQAIARALGRERRDLFPDPEEREASA